MINTNNLVLGSHVTVNSGGKAFDIMITAIDKKEVSGAPLPGGPEDGPYRDSQLAGIPIEESYLHSFSYRKNKEGYFDSNSGFQLRPVAEGLWDMYMLTIDNEKYFPLRKGLKHIHELQRVVWGVTGDPNDVM